VEATLATTLPFETSLTGPDSGRSAAKSGIRPPPSGCTPGRLVRRAAPPPVGLPGTVDGPAIVVEDGSTTVVDAGWRAAVGPDSW